ncbi:MAG: B12-binding domain-containing radical SAM protein [Oligoflexia bacterium]|nr:B12-binding domain-containing radical SAM protein [Oligoflexia bacterium]
MDTNVDLLLVRANDRKKVYGDLNTNISAIEPPLWMLIIASFLRERGYKVMIIDMEIENLLPDDLIDKLILINPLLIGIFVTGNNLAASTWNMLGASKVLTTISSIKERRFKIFIWGLHPSSLPERTLNEENVDYLIQGEGLFSIEKLISNLKQNVDSDQWTIKGLWYKKKNSTAYSKTKITSDIVTDLNLLPMPAWDLIPLHKYRAHNWQCFQNLEKREPYAVIYTSLGCPYNCSFCNLKTLFGHRGVRFRSPINVVNELFLLSNIYKVKNIKILDECFVLQRDHVEKICDFIIERNLDLNIWAYARIDTVDFDLLKKLKKAGVNWLCYGIESANSFVLRDVIKTGFNNNNVRQSIKMTKDAGINILANFMFGLPEDTMDTMQETLALAKELNCEYNNFYTTMAYPGSDLYDSALKNGVKLPESWIGYSQFSEETLPLPTKYLTSSEVLQFRDNAFYDFHQDINYLQMIENKFGTNVVRHINEVTSYRITRKYI